MKPDEDHLHIFTNGVFSQIEPPDESEAAYLESLVRADYERCHPDETFDDLKNRARVSKDDKGLLRDWMALALRRSAASRSETIMTNLPMAAE